jgi:hypothetical protein
MSLFIFLSFLRKSKSPMKKGWKSWEMEDKNTSLILEDMGMSLIDEDSQDRCLGPTPPCYDSENIPPPQVSISGLNS